MTKFYDAVYSFERVGGYQFVKLYISMFEKGLESPQWLLAVTKPEVRMRVTSAWGQEYFDSDRKRAFFEQAISAGFWDKLCKILSCRFVANTYLMCHLYENIVYFAYNTK